MFGAANSYLNQAGQNDFLHLLVHLVIIYPRRVIGWLLLWNIIGIVLTVSRVRVILLRGGDVGFWHRAQRLVGPAQLLSWGFLSFWLLPSGLVLGVSI
jgi:hypothetical protein